MHGGRADSGVRVAVGLSMAGKAAELVTLLVLATVVPRALGPSDYGRFALPLTVVTVGTLALTLGGPTTVARFVPVAPPEQRVALARRLGGELARTRIVHLAVLGVAALALVVWDPSHFPPLLTGLAFIALVVNVVATLALQVGLGLGRTGVWSARYAVHNAVLILGVLVLYELGGVSGAGAALVLAALAALAVGLHVLRPTIGVRTNDIALPDGALRFGALQSAGAALVQLAQRGGVVAVAVLASDPTQTGYAALATGVALGAGAAVLQAFTVSLPHVAEEAELGGLEDAEATLRRLAGVLFAVLAPACLLGALLLHRLVPAVFGGEYRDSTTVFGPALAMVVMAPISSLAVQVSALRLRPQASLVSGVVGLVVFVVVAAVAVPAWGATGGTAAVLAGAVAGTAASSVLLPDALGGPLLVGSLTGAAGVLAVAAWM
jgi:O-antigen/teichoic acid export membrane protein